MKLEFPGAVPEIPVRDINEAAAYYENNLGFTVDWGDEDLGLAGISRGDCRMFLANSDFREHHGNVGPVGRVIYRDKNNEFELVVEVGDFLSINFLSRRRIVA